MKLKRAMFVVILIILFVLCLFKMNERFDELARYPHELSEEQRELVLNHFNTEDINFLVAQKIEPDQFLPYMEETDFILENTAWYHIAYQTQKESKSYIISFINKYKARMSYGEVKEVLSNYTYNVLTRFFDEGDGYVADSKLLANPSGMLTLIPNERTLYTYEPKKLVTINDLPHANIISKNDITICEEVVKPLRELCAAAKDINNKECGDMKITAAYISYENQIPLYEKALEKQRDKVLSYWDYPGKSEYQLGYSIQLKPNEDHQSTNTIDKGLSEEEQEQAIWLKDNAFKYGFIIRYPKQKEDVTGKKYQPYTIRYVGRDLANYMQDHNVALEEVNVNDFKE